jgi:hypothetical protein
MAREIRISVDDDEVFERMKHRKQLLDLSWEEVLHRGLRETDTPRGPGRGAEFWDDRYDDGPDGRARSQRGSVGGIEWERHNPDMWDTLGDSLEQQIQRRVYETLQSSFGAAGIDISDRPGMGAEMEELASAEDAVLTFDGLPDDEAYEVPLRVDMQTGPDALIIDVVAVREGKSVRDANRFETDARKRINTALARGGTATLSFDGAEQYEVRPVLSWGRTSTGTPRVADVDIVEVVLDADE